MTNPKRNEDKIGKLSSLTKRLLVITFSLKNLSLCCYSSAVINKPEEREV